MAWAASAVIATATSSHSPTRAGVVLVFALQQPPACAAATRTSSHTAGDHDVVLPTGALHVERELPVAGHPAEPVERVFALAGFLRGHGLAAVAVLGHRGFARDVAAGDGRPGVVGEDER